MILHLTGLRLSARREASKERREFRQVETPQASAERVRAGCRRYRNGFNVSAHTRMREMRERRNSN